ncbi:MAG: CBS domain-containing protein [Desulfobacterales bacterium]|nr:CBS domain-containing protein [Desulfobacterales bacterium]
MNKNDYLKYLIDISDDDITEAMKEIEGYIDITLGDFKELYFFTCNHAAKRLIHSVRAKDIMTKEVIFAERDASIEEVAGMMASHVVSGVPVTGNEGEVIGVISEKDFLYHMGNKETKSFMGIITQCLSSKECIAMPIRKKKAEDIMISPAITVNENTSVFEIMNIFTEKKINRVPVLSQKMKLAGIVSRADILRTQLPKEKE